MKRTAALLAAAALTAGLAAGFGGTRSAQAAGGCTGNPDALQATGGAFGLSGLYTLPRTTPTGLAVFAHGHGADSGTWSDHLREAARDHGVVAVAVDYRGTSGELHSGWPVSAGAEDLVTAARYFTGRCPSIATVALMGVGMGGEASGLALAAAPSRADGSALFDYWVNVEGVGELAQTWGQLATFGGPCVGSVCIPGPETPASIERSEIESEAGGNPATAPAAFAARSPLARLQDLGKAGLKGAAIVHAMEDGEVPFPQAIQLTAGLRAERIPTDLYPVARASADSTGGDHPDRRVTSHVPAPLPDPMAGFGWEGSPDNIVIRTGLNVTWGLLDAAHAKPANNQVLVDGQPGGGRAGTTPTPAVIDCRCAPRGLRLV